MCYRCTAQQRRKTQIVGNPVKLITPKRFGDSRGWFSETYVATRWAQQGVDVTFVQDNHSFSGPVGTIRGIHFQIPPHPQAKLVRCLRGAIIDYAVDLRKGSPTYGQFAAAELTAKNGHQLYLPVGFGHAFVTTAPDTEVLYKVSDFYAPDCEGGVRWNCLDIGIDWPLPASGPVLSDKDVTLPLLAQFESPFTYTGDPLEPIEAP
nr:dTDP-4-dehydrorhamnose 3,5-epimerase [Sphingobium sp. EM0848]